MNLQYELSNLALVDLDLIWQYTSDRWSIQQANKYYMEIFDAIEDICSHPLIGKSIAEIKEHHRLKLINSHIIIYKIENKKVLIDRILHQKMDLDSKFYVS